MTSTTTPALPRGKRKEVSITSIACFYGFNTKGGAAGVGKTTTATVVVSCVAIVFLDYILGEIILL